MCVCVCVFIYVYIYICMYIYIYNMYVHMCIYIHIHADKEVYICFWVNPPGKHLTPSKPEPYPGLKVLCSY